MSSKPIGCTESDQNVLQLLVAPIRCWSFETDVGGIIIEKIVHSYNKSLMKHIKDELPNIIIGNGQDGQDGQSSRLSLTVASFMNIV